MTKKFVPKHLTGVVGVALAMTLASCAQSESGTPITATPEVGITSPSASADSSTTIKNPIDTTHLLRQPCAALADDDLAELNLTEGKLQEDTASQFADACIWERTGGSGSHADLIVMTENANGLEDIRYMNQDSEVYEELYIGDYPALHASPSDNRHRGRCDLWIGVNDSEVAYIYLVLRDVPEADAPCSYADRVGEAMIANLSP